MFRVIFWLTSAKLITIHFLPRYIFHGKAGILSLGWILALLFLVSGCAKPNTGNQPITDTQYYQDCYASYNSLVSSQRFRNNVSISEILRDLNLPGGELALTFEYDPEVEDEKALESIPYLNRPALDNVSYLKSPEAQNLSLEKRLELYAKFLELESTKFTEVLEHTKAANECYQTSYETLRRDNLLRFTYYRETSDRLKEIKTSSGDAVKVIGKYLDRLKANLQIYDEIADDLTRVLPIASGSLSNAFAELKKQRGKFTENLDQIKPYYDGLESLSTSYLRGFITHPLGMRAYLHPWMFHMWPYHYFSPYWYWY
ncbi:MAG: hypothetical protein LBF22_15625 [Deltaproteobacteria bacterium]|jgi:hypothetical protein|nr:hypothetical protein [Deltaproteobacteria bacterium]